MIKSGRSRVWFGWANANETRLLGRARQVATLLIQSRALVFQERHVVLEVPSTVGDIRIRRVVSCRDQPSGICHVDQEQGQSDGQLLHHRKFPLCYVAAVSWQILAAICVLLAREGKRAVCAVCLVPMAAVGRVGGLLGLARRVWLLLAWTLGVLTQGAVLEAEACLITREYKENTAARRPWKSAKKARRSIQKREDHGRTYSSQLSGPLLLLRDTRRTKLEDDWPECIFPQALFQPWRHLFTSMHRACLHAAMLSVYGHTRAPSHRPTRRNFTAVSAQAALFQAQAAARKLLSASCCTQVARHLSSSCSVHVALCKFPLRKTLGACVCAQDAQPELSCGGAPRTIRLRFRVAIFRSEPPGVHSTYYGFFA